MQTFGQMNVTGSVEIGASDAADLIRATAGVGDGEVIMPSAADVLGKRYTIRRITGVILVLPASESGDTFDGNDDWVLTSSDRKVTFQAVQLGPTTYGYESI